LREAGSEQRMVKVSGGFGARADTVEVGCRTAPEAAQLREDEPHPVARLPSSTQLVEDVRIDLILRRDEAVEISGR
jgi:hypothetical protein